MKRRVDRTEGVLEPGGRPAVSIKLPSSAEPQLVRKWAFAEMCGVTPGRVTQWIAEGKIRGSALVSRGRAEMIDADLARAQLRNALDVDKRFGLNGLSTNLRGPSEPTTLFDCSIETQIKAEKLRHAQLLTSRLEEEDRTRRGVYIEAAAARSELTRALSDLLRTFEGALPDFASAVAAKFQVPQRDALHLLRQEFRRMRERAAAVHAMVAAAVPQTIEAPSRSLMASNEPGNGKGRPESRPCVAKGPLRRSADLWWRPIFAAPSPERVLPEPLGKAAGRGLAEKR